MEKHVGWEFIFLKYLIGYETNEEHPQDLSCNKDGTVMDVEESSEQKQTSVISPNVSMEQSSSSRPQIIVSSRKLEHKQEQNASGSNAGLSLPSLSSLLLNSAGSSDLNTEYNSQTTHSSRSPSKSVIVRAGSSAVSIFFL